MPINEEAPQSATGRVLTIAIPTYNRNALLNATLEDLLPQLTQECELLILDNSSSVSVESSSGGLVERFPQHKVTLVRNKMNIGGNANIMRCFEYAEADYLWLLSDDDKVLPNAVAMILDLIKKNPGVIFFNFKTDQAAARETEWRTKGVTELLRSVDNFANLLFISTSVYDLKRIRKNISTGYHYTYSMAPHLATLLTTIGPSDECYFLKDPVVLWTRPDAGSVWPMVQQALGVMTLADLPLSWEAKRMLGKMIRKGRIPLPNLLPTLAKGALNAGETDTSFHSFQQIRVRSWPFDPSFDKLKFWLCNLLLLSPRLVLLLRRVSRGTPREQVLIDHESTSRGL